MKTESPDRSAAYWQAYLDTLPEDGRREGYEVWGFGEAADELGALIRDGIKTATCSLLWKYEYDGDALPQAGEQRVILDGTGWPMCVIETTEVTIRPFDAVDARLDYDEGEGDRSHVSWRDGHWVSFARVCTRIGRSVDETSEMKTLFGCIRQEVDYIPVNGRVTLGLPE